MDIDILTLSVFSHLNLQAKRNHKNAGGGMASLINAAKGALMTRYRTNIVNAVEDLQGQIVLMDAIYISNRPMPEGSDIDAVDQTINDLVTDKICNPQRQYILWCAEKTMLRLNPLKRYAILNLVDCVVVTDPYIAQLFRTINVPVIGYLCDAIDPDLFRPAEKEMTVTAVGALKHIKNIDWIIEVFKQLDGHMKRTYLGSAGLWGHIQPEDMPLIQQIKSVTDEYHPNASIVEVAYHNARAAFTVNDTWHDCSSRANEELLMSGVISLHGQHDLFTPRPGFRVKTPEEAVAKISELTHGFKQLPAKKLHKASRQWALTHVSRDRFLAQFETLIGAFI